MVLLLDSSIKALLLVLGYLYTSSSSCKCCTTFLLELNEQTTCPVKGNLWKDVNFRNIWCVVFQYSCPCFTCSTEAVVFSKNENLYISVRPGFLKTGLSTKMKRCVYNSLRAMILSFFSVVCSIYFSVWRPHYVSLFLNRFIKLDDSWGFCHHLQKSAASGTNYKLSPCAPGCRFIITHFVSTKRKHDDRKNVVRAWRISIYDCIYVLFWLQSKVINCQFLPFISKIRPASPIKLCIILMYSPWTSAYKKWIKVIRYFFH